MTHLQLDICLPDSSRTIFQWASVRWQRGAKERGNLQAWPPGISKPPPWHAARSFASLTYRDVVARDVLSWFGAACRLSRRTGAIFAVDQAAASERVAPGVSKGQGHASRAALVARRRSIGAASKVRKHSRPYLRCRVPQSQTSPAPDPDAARTVVSVLRSSLGARYSGMTNRTSSRST